jgi:sensor histidine kinase YesM
LRATLGSSRTTMQPLKTEFARLRDYLELMSIRMGKRLNFTLDLLPDLADVPVPALLLQPLVENAIRHGLEPKVEGGHIAVQAHLSGHMLVLDVKDTGVGMSPEGSTPGFGLAQVRERLSTLYGPQGTIEFVADSAYPTWARVTFPVEQS